MRAIKFRGQAYKTEAAYRIDKGKWIFGSLFHDPRDGTCHIWDETLEYWVRVDPATVGQFTGLTDKDGKEIFEGDILLRDRCVENPCIVEFENGGFKIHDRNVYSPLCAIIQFSHIIGNIHDNPELLENE